MNYSVFVPVVNHYNDRFAAVRQLRRLRARRVFLCESRGLADSETLAAEYEQLKKSIAFYEAEGFETAVWISTIGHGGELVGASEAVSTEGMTNITGFHGEYSGDSFCPLDDVFTTAVCNHVKNLALAGAKMIMLDDDYRLSLRKNAIGCYCDRHRAEYERRVDETLTGGEAFKKIFSGEPNKYRDAWLEMSGDTLRDFARKIRAAVDEVSEDIRLGHCAVMTTYDTDGVDSFELAQIFAGKTKPFLRFIGAPYWAAGSGFLTHLQYVVECERMQEYWARGRDIEIFSEGDVYPRPRYIVPAAYLEGMDTALRASGGFNGILKYALDYCSGAEYETGYTDRAEKNDPLYAEIERRFADKSAVGVSVTATMKKIADSVYPEKPYNEGFYTTEQFFQPEQTFLCDNSLPITYERGGALVVFGENARHLSPERFSDGLIIDAPAAMILKQRGVDTGVESISLMERMPNNELFGEQNTPLDGVGAYYDMKISKDACVLSKAGDSVGCCRYENAKGERFLIYAFDATLCRKSKRVFASYSRQKQLIENVEWLCGKKLPAVCEKNPYVYIMCKKTDSSMAVGVWNFFEDSVLQPVIKLDAPRERIEFIGCEGTLCGDTVRINGEIPAYSFVGFEVF